MSGASGLPEALGRLAARRPDRGIGIFDGRGRNCERRTYPEMLAAARAVAARLVAGPAGLAGLRSIEGERVVVSLPTTWQWFDAWFGALHAGALPVALAPGAALGGRDLMLRRVEGVVERLGAKLLVCEAGLKEDLAREGGRAAAVAVTPDELAAAPERRGFRPPDPEPASAAFLQLTSGSTGVPRAVMISHRAVLHHVEALDERAGAPFGVRSREVIESLVSWLPLYHDMGLVGVFYCLANGVDLWLLPPRAFLGRPRLWLENLGSRGTTLAAAPNFGYQLAAERLGDDEAAAIDLSGFRAALTGAEMIRADTLEAFIGRFAASGYDRRSFRPCYGLAEGTLAVTLDERGEGPRTLPLPPGAEAGLGLEEVVSTGPPLADTEVVIAAPDGASLPEGAVGEVRAKGPAIFDGYWGDPAATAEALVDGWLHTGDLGFLDGGELFLVGRLKELLIVRGQNLMPHELEWVAESAAGAGGGERAAAFTVARGGEGEEIVLVVEVSGREEEALAAVEEAVRVKVGREIGLPVADVALVRRGKIPKTTSGKLQRRELRRLYLDGRIERLR